MRSTTTSTARWSSTPSRSPPSYSFSDGWSSAFWRHTPWSPRNCRACTTGRGRDEIVDDALKSGRNDYLGGRIIYYETISKPTFKNALRLFEDWDIIERVEGKKKRRIRVHAR